LTISVSGTFSEIKEIIGIQSQAQFLEINISCPNSSKEMISIPKLSRLPHLIPFGIKLPPYFDLPEIEAMAEKLKAMAKDQPNFSYIVCCNTIPFERGGLGGPILKPTSLYNIEYFRKLLPDKIEIWGCGGIRQWEDMVEYELAGASGIQIGTTAIDKGLEYTDELIELYRNTTGQ